MGQLEKESDYFMSIDYSDMAFPKPKKKKKRISHPKSILNTEKGVCYLCANLYGDYRQQYTEEHHVLFGSGMRILSEAEGLKVYLCEPHHKSGKEAVHNCRKTRELLCEIAQREYERSHTRKDWLKISKKNYLDQQELMKEPQNEKQKEGHPGFQFL